MASHRNAVFAMQFPLPFGKTNVAISLQETESQNSYVEKIHSLHPPLLGRVESFVITDFSFSRAPINRN